MSDKSDEFTIYETKHNGEDKYVAVSEDYPISAVGDSKEEAIKETREAIEKTNFPDEELELLTDPYPDDFEPEQYDPLQPSRTVRCPYCGTTDTGVIKPEKARCGNDDCKCLVFTFDESDEAHEIGIDPNEIDGEVIVKFEDTRVDYDKHDDYEVEDSEEEDDGKTMRYSDEIVVKEKEPDVYLAMHEIKPVCGSGETIEKAVEHVLDLAETTNVLKGELDKEDVIDDIGEYIADKTDSTKEELEENRIYWIAEADENDPSEFIAKHSDKSAEDIRENSVEWSPEEGEFVEDDLDDIPEMVRERMEFLKEISELSDEEKRYLVKQLQKDLDEDDAVNPTFGASSGGLSDFDFNRTKDSFKEFLTAVFGEEPEDYSKFSDFGDSSTEDPIEGGETPSVDDEQYIDGTRITKKNIIDCLSVEGTTVSELADAWSVSEEDIIETLSDENQLTSYSDDFESEQFDSSETYCVVECPHCGSTNTSIIRPEKARCGNEDCRTRVFDFDESDEAYRIGIN